VGTIAVFSGERQCCNSRSCGGHQGWRNEQEQNNNIKIERIEADSTCEGFCYNSNEKRQLLRCIMLQVAETFHDKSVTKSRGLLRSRRDENDREVYMSEVCEESVEETCWGHSN